MLRSVYSVRVALWLCMLVQCFSHMFRFADVRTASVSCSKYGISLVACGHAMVKQPYFTTLKANLALMARATAFFSAASMIGMLSHNSYICTIMCGEIDFWGTTWFVAFKSTGPHADTHCIMMKE